MISKKKDIWNQITKNLESKLPKPEFNTWFSRTTLEKLAPGQAVIGVPNKYVSNWLQERYLVEIKKSFKEILRQEPDIRFAHDPPHIKKSFATTIPLEKSDPDFKHYLDPSMTFRGFIMGKGNRFARTSALEVAKGTNNDYNPLYIYCHMGLGKTHLLHAIGNYIISQDPSPRIKYLSSDTFTADFVTFSKNKKIF